MDRQLRALATSLLVRQRLTGLLCKENAADLERLTEYVESGQLTPVVDRTCRLEQVPDAMREPRGRPGRGQDRGQDLRPQFASAGTAIAHFRPRGSYWR